MMQRCLNRWYARQCWSLAFIALLSVSARGQSVQAPEQATDWTEVVESIEATRQEWDVPGLAVAIVQDDQVVLAQGFGTLELGGTAKVDADTLFAIASNTKAFTAAAIAMLVEDGRLKWDERVRDHLPYFQLSDEYASAEMTVRDLLCHRSGLGTYSGDLVWYGTSYSVEQVLRRMRYVPRASSFRSSYGYNNVMFLAAGEVIEAVSDEPWELFIRKRILTPLGMDRTVTSVSDLAALSNVATPHKFTRTGPKVIPWMKWDSTAAAGGIISSVNDMTHWMRFQLRGGTVEPEGTRLLREDSIETMWSAHTPLSVTKESRAQIPSTHFRAYGLGWELRDYQGVKVISHGGGYDGMFSRLTLVPEKNLGIVVLTNSMTNVAGALSLSLVDHGLAREPFDWNKELLPAFRKEREAYYRRIDEAIKPVANAKDPSRPLSEYAGTFSCPLYGDVVVRLHQGRLELQFVPFPQLIADLSHLHFDTFLLKWRHESAWFDEGTVQFVPDSRGRFVRLRFDVPNDDLWFYELQLTRVDDPVQ